MNHAAASQRLYWQLSRMKQNTCESFRQHNLALDLKVAGDRRRSGSGLTAAERGREQARNRRFTPCQRHTPSPTVIRRPLAARSPRPAPNLGYTNNAVSGFGLKSPLLVRGVPVTWPYNGLPAEVPYGAQQCRNLSPATTT